MSRVPTVMGHERIAYFRSTDTADAQTIGKANAYNHDYLISFVHTAHVPGKYNRSVMLSPPKSDPKPYLTPLAVRDVKDVMAASSVETWEKARMVEKVVLPHLPRLRTGVGAQTSSGKWLVVMRPVRALQPSCISCHTGARQGDTLGVMVYAVDKTVGNGGAAAAR